MRPIQTLNNSPGDSPTESPRQDPRRQIAHEPLGLLVSKIPSGDHEDHSWTEARLGHAKEKTHTDELSWCLHQRRQCGYGAPENHQCWNPDGGAQVGENHAVVYVRLGIVGEMGGATLKELGRTHSRVER